MIDLAALSDADLEALQRDVAGEVERRTTIAAAPVLIEQAAAAWQEASGRQDGDAWTQPAGAHDAYAVGARVTHDGAMWRNLVPANVWPPGVAGWREVVPDGELAAWVQPLSAADAYRKGDRVAHGALAYESLVDGNGWPPTNAARWKVVTIAPAAPQWRQPTGAHDAYQKGDRVTWQGLVIESLIDGNVWAPDAYPQGWRAVT